MLATNISLGLETLWYALWAVGVAIVAYNGVTRRLRARRQRRSREQTWREERAARIAAAKAALWRPDPAKVRAATERLPSA